MSVITIKGLCKSFGETKVLENVDLSIEQGERVVIIGGSGCGKSVLLRSIELLTKPDRGQIFIGEDEITGANERQLNRIRQKMGMVYQNFCLFSHRNVLDNITMAPMKLRGIPKEEAEEKACELLQTIGLENRKYAMPDELSGGQKQRIAIVRCLAMEPEIMLFDEPTSALDPSMTGEVLATMRMLAKRGMTMVVVTHEMKFAREFGSRILYLNDFGIYEQGTPEELFDHPKKPKTIQFICKLKFFSMHIASRAFDLMALQGGIIRFTEKYGISERRSNNLQLCTEELIYEMLGGAVEEGGAVSADAEVEYGEADGAVLLNVSCAGKEYNPFNAPENDEMHLGITILRRWGRKLTFEYRDGLNRISVTL